MAIEEFLILYAPFGTVVLCFCFTVLLLPQTLRVVLKKTALPLRGFFGAGPLRGCCTARVVKYF